MVRCRQLLPCPEDCPSIIYALMIECWHEQPARRPTFREIHGRLRTWQAMPDITAGHLASHHSQYSAGGSQHSSTGPSNNTGSTSLSRAAAGGQPPPPPAPALPPQPPQYRQGPPVFSTGRPSTPGSAVTVRRNENYTGIPDSKISNV